jgi:hypothetical protein
MSGIQYNEQQLVLDNFMKGLVSKIADDMIPSDAMADCLNVDMSENNCVKSIKGFKKFNENPISVDSENPNDTYPIKGAIVYKTDNFKDIVIVACGGYLWSAEIPDKTQNGFAAFTKIKINLKQKENEGDNIQDLKIDENSEPEFVQYGNKVFMVNARANIIANQNENGGLINPNSKMIVLYVSGYDVVAVDIAKAKIVDPIYFKDIEINTDRLPQGIKYLCVHNERLFGAYSEGADSETQLAEPNGIWWSEPYNPFKWEGLYGLNYDSVGRDDGELITGIASFNENFVYVFKPHNVYRYYTVGDITSWASNKVDTNYGAVAHRTIKLFEGNLVYLSQEGVAVLNGNEAKLVSENIGDKFKRISDLYTTQIRQDSWIKEGNGWKLASKLSGAIANSDSLTAFCNVYQGTGGEILANEKKYSFDEKESVDGNLEVSENEIVYKDNLEQINTAEDITTPPSVYSPEGIQTGLGFASGIQPNIFRWFHSGSGHGITFMAYFEIVQPSKDICIRSATFWAHQKSGDMSSVSNRYGFQICEEAGAKTEILRVLPPANFENLYENAGAYTFHFNQIKLKKGVRYEFRIFQSHPITGDWENTDNCYFNFDKGTIEAQKSAYKEFGYYTNNWNPTTDVVKGRADFNYYNLPNIYEDTNSDYASYNQYTARFSNYSQYEDALVFGVMRPANRLLHNVFGNSSAGIKYTSQALDLKLQSNSNDLRQRLRLELLRSASQNYSFKLIVANFDDENLLFDNITADKGMKQTYTFTQNTAATAANSFDLNTGVFANGFYYRYLKYRIELNEEMTTATNFKISKIRFFKEKDNAIANFNYPAEYISEPQRIAVRDITQWGSFNVEMNYDWRNETGGADEEKLAKKQVRFYIKVVNRNIDLDKVDWIEIRENEVLPSLPVGAIIQMRVVMGINSDIEIKLMSLEFITSEKDIYSCAIVWQGQYILNISDGTTGVLNNVSYVLDKRGYWTKRDLENNMIYFKASDRLLSGDNTEGYVYIDELDNYTNNGAQYESYFITKNFRLSDVENLFKRIKILYKSELPVKISYSIDEGEWADYLEIEPTPLNRDGNNRLNEIREVLSGINRGQTIQFKFSWLSNATTEIHKLELIWSVLRELNRR